MNFIPKKTLMACLAIAISSTAYAQDNLLTRIVGGVANAIITKASYEIDKRRVQRSKERQEKETLKEIEEKEKRKNPEYLTKVGNEYCQKATELHRDYLSKLVLAKDNVAYKKTLQSYYDSFGDKDQFVQQVVYLASSIWERAPSYETRKEIMQDSNIQAKLTDLFKDDQDACLKGVAKGADEFARKERREQYPSLYIANIENRPSNGSDFDENYAYKSFDVIFYDNTFRFMIEPKFYNDGERRYIENEICSRFDNLVVHDKNDDFNEVKKEVKRWKEDKDKSSEQLFNEQNEKDIRVIPNLKALAYVGTYVMGRVPHIRDRIDRPLYEISRNSEFDIDIAKTCPDVQSKIAKKKERIAKKYAENGEQIRQHWADKKKECLNQKPREDYKWKITEKYRYFDGKYVEEGKCDLSDAYYRKAKKECNEAGRRWFADEKECESLPVIIEERGTTGRSINIFDFF